MFIRAGGILAAGLLLMVFGWAQEPSQGPAPSGQPSSSAQTTDPASAGSSSSTAETPVGSSEKGPAVAPENEKPVKKKPSWLKRAIKRGAPNCAGMGDLGGCWSDSANEEKRRAEEEEAAEHERRHAEEKRQWEEQQRRARGQVPASEPMPRSADGSSSSRDTKLDLEAPSGSGYPGGSDLNELRPYDPHRAEKNVEIGDFYYKRGNYKAAISRYREALEWKPNDALAMFRLGQALEKDGSLKEARSSYEGYLRILPKGEYAEPAREAIERLTSQLQQTARAQ